MIRKPVIVLAVGLMGPLAPQALAEPLDNSLDTSVGVIEVAFGGYGDGLSAVSDNDLNTLRGGAGVVFSGSFYGEVSGPTATAIPDGFTVDATSPNRVLVTSAFGSFNDFSGIVQIANIVGNMNTVNNVLNLNVTIEPARAGVMPMSLIN